MQAWQVVHRDWQHTETKHAAAASSQHWFCMLLSSYSLSSLSSSSAASQLGCFTLTSVMYHRRKSPFRFNSHFPDEPGLAGVYWSKGWWRWWWQLDYWSYRSCKAPVKSSPPTNQHLVPCHRRKSQLYKALWIVTRDISMSMYFSDVIWSVRQPCRLVDM